MSNFLDVLLIRCVGQKTLKNLDPRPWSVTCSSNQTILNMNQLIYDITEPLTWLQRVKPSVLIITAVCGSSKEKNKSKQVTHLKGFSCLSSVFIIFCVCSAGMSPVCVRLVMCDGESGIEVRRWSDIKSVHYIVSRWVYHTYKYTFLNRRLVTNTKHNMYRE